MLRKCKCGMPIYDEPGQRYDKCYQCMVKSFRTAVEKRLFTGMNLKERIMEEPRPPNCVCCEYMGVCDSDRRGQKMDYCPDPKYRIWLSKDKPNVVGNAEL